MPEYPFLPSKLNEQLEAIYKVLGNHAMLLEALAEGFMVERVDYFTWLDLRTDLVAYARDLTDTVGRLDSGTGGEAVSEAPSEYGTLAKPLLDLRDTWERVENTQKHYLHLPVVNASKASSDSAYVDALVRAYLKALTLCLRRYPAEVVAFSAELSKHVSGVPPAMTEYLDLAQHRIDALWKQLGDRGLVDAEVGAEDGRISDSDITVIIKPPSSWLWDRVRPLIDRVFDSQVRWWFGLFARVLDHIWDDPDPLSEVSEPDLFTEMDLDTKWNRIKDKWPSGEAIA